MCIIDIKLPHKEPVRFIKEVLTEGRNHAISLVKFNETPTLPAVVEASAQNTIFILSLFEIYHTGLLTGMKNIQVYQELKAGIYRVETTITASLDNFFIFNFVLSQNSKKFVDGEITILLEKRDEKL